MANESVFIIQICLYLKSLGPASVMHTELIYLFFLGKKYTYILIWVLFPDMFVSLRKDQGVLTLWSIQNKFPRTHTSGHMSLFAIMLGKSKIAVFKHRVRKEGWLLWDKNLFCLCHYLPRAYYCFWRVNKYDKGQREDSISRTREMVVWLVLDFVI